MAKLRGRGIASNGRFRPGGGSVADSLPARRSLLRDAWALLERGPLGTGEVARRVLGLDGHPGAASAAVFALLGGDHRFVVDGEGVWSLRDGARRPGLPLSRLRYAVVDVETTGGRYEGGHRMTEVSVVEVRGGVVAEVFDTLLQPGRAVPRRTVSLTGITDRMLAGAPTFDEVAEEVFRRISGRVFVAHNAGFDWGWLRAQLGDALGDVPDVDRLCTMSLARRLVPELRRRNLDALAEFFDVPIPLRHRARGDALATARVLLRLLDRAESLGIGDLRSLKRYRPPRTARHQGDLFAPGGQWSRARARPPI